MPTKLAEKVNPSILNYRVLMYEFTQGSIPIPRTVKCCRRYSVASSPTTAMADRRFCLSENRGLERRSKRDEDFEEEDVRGYVKERERSSCMSKKLDDYYSSSSSPSSSSCRQLNTTPRMTRKANHAAPYFEPERVKQSSAPLDIPDWSRIYGRSNKMGFWVGDGDKDHYDREGDGNEEEDVNDGMVPPHEWIATKLARTQMSSFSVCEGVGRTLKGRDLSKLRNAILTKTGFLE